MSRLKREEEHLTSKPPFTYGWLAGRQAMRMLAIYALCFITFPFIPMVGLACVFWIIIPNLAPFCGHWIAAHVSGAFVFWFSLLVGIPASFAVMFSWGTLFAVFFGAGVGTAEDAVNRSRQWGSKVSKVKRERMKLAEQRIRAAMKRGENFEGKKVDYWDDLDK